jgi:hypothetical protein
MMPVSVRAGSYPKTLSAFWREEEWQQAIAYERGAKILGPRS